MAATPSNPDAELIRLCAAFDKLTAEYSATDHDVLFDTPEGERAEAERARINDLQDELIDPICALRPTTVTFSNKWAPPHEACWARRRGWV